jgi:hypothetical protein
VVFTVGLPLLHGLLDECLVIVSAGKLHYFGSDENITLA